MADIASTDVTITVEKQTTNFKEHRNRVKIVFGNGTLTYPAGGVPLPAYNFFGLVQSLDYLILTDGDDATGIFWKFDQANKKLRGYIQGVVIEAAAAGTLDDHALDGTLDPLAAAGRQPSNGAVSLGMVASAAGTVYLGAFKELLAAEHAPASQTIYAVAIGW